MTKQKEFGAQEDKQNINIQIKQEIKILALNIRKKTVKLKRREKIGKQKQITKQE